MMFGYFILQVLTILINLKQFAVTMITNKKQGNKELLLEHATRAHFLILCIALTFL